VSVAEQTLEIAGLRTTVVGAQSAVLTVILLHGYAMTPADLAPFAHSLRLPARFVLPRGPVAAADGKAAWWPIDEERRSTQIAAGPRDLSNEYPPGLPGARERLGQLIRELPEPSEGGVVLGGFSQGGMLSMDFALRGDSSIQGLALWSASRLALEDWLPHRQRLRDLPVTVSHGRSDPDLAFEAGEALRDFCTDSEARVEWTPFEGAHEIPFVVWRTFRKFLFPLTTPQQNRSISYAD
jgi:phospholipase/carboxylesterase